ncbi:MAG TPA: hypothetical protein VGL65_03685 [Gemmatimonadales bacterium]
MARWGLWAAIGIGYLAAACASTIGPVTPPVEVLVVLDSTDDTLRIIPVDSIGVVHHLIITPRTSKITALALHGQVAAISDSDDVMFLDLGSHHSACIDGHPVALNAQGVIGSLVFNDDGQGYASTPSTDSVSHFLAPPVCGAGTGSVAGTPQGFGVARGRVFVVVANRQGCPLGTNGCPDAPSWLTTEPGVRDSFPLLGPGDARSGIFASDGSLYVVSAGDGSSDGILSQIDPLQPGNVNSYSGFGHAPQYLATDGADRIFVASPVDGLMVFNVRTHQVERGVNAAVPLNGAAHGLATDDFGRIYALTAGSCTASGARGSVQILGSDLVAQHPIAVGRCPIGIGVTEIPAALYHFDN